MAHLILILDDSELIVGMLEMICAQLGYRTVSATEFWQVAGLVAQETPSVVLSDLNLPDVPNNEPVSALRSIGALTQVPIVVISGIDQGELDQIAVSRGAQGAISKDAGLPGMMMQLEPLLQQLTS